MKRFSQRSFDWPLAKVRLNQCWLRACVLILSCIGLAAIDPGSLDPTFAVNATNIPITSQLVVLSDGHILMGQDANRRAKTGIVQRFLPNGKRDPTFDTYGLPYDSFLHMEDAGGGRLYVLAYQGIAAQDARLIRL